MPRHLTEGPLLRALSRLVTPGTGVVTTTVLVGLAIAVGLSLAMLLYRASRPYIAAVGKLHGVKAAYGDIGRHPDAQPVPGLLILRIDAPLYFFNANVARTSILQMLTDADPPPEAVLLDIGATSDLDITTADMIRQLAGDLEERSIELLMAQVKGAARDRMRRTDLMTVIGDEHVYLSVGAAVKAFRAEEDGSDASEPAPPV